MSIKEINNTLIKRDILERYFGEIFWRDILERYFGEIFWRDILERYFSNYMHL